LSKKKETINRIISSVMVLVTLTMLILTFPIFVFAADISDNYPDTVVMPYFSSNYIKNRVDIIDSFDTPTSIAAWIPVQNVTGISAESSFAESPYKPVEGSRCLHVKGSLDNLQSWRYIERNYNEHPLDLSKYSAFMIAVSCPDIFDTEYRALIQFTSEDGTIKRFFADITPDTWNAVVCDISDFTGRSSITSIRIGIQYKNANLESGSFSSYNFQVDCMAVSENRFLGRALWFLEGNYNLWSANMNIEYSYSPMKMTLSILPALRNEYLIYTDTLAEGLFNSADAVKIRLINKSECNSISIEYTTRDDSQTDTIITKTENIIKSDELQTVYFSIPETDIEQLSFIFRGGNEGNIEIYSITPVSFYSPLDKNDTSSASATSSGSIISCKITSDKKKILIEGKLSEDFVASNKNCSILLYEIEPFEKNDYIFKDEAKHIASTSISQNFSFEIPLYDAERSRITSRFAAVIYNNDKKRSVLIGSPVYITNPDVLSSASWLYISDSVSKKGLLASADTLIETNSSWTEIEINIGKIFSAESTENEFSISHEYNGKKYYFDRTYVQSIDNIINKAVIAGTYINLRFILTKPTYPEFASVLIHPEAISRIDSMYAFNTETSDGTEALEAVSNFIASRYMTDGIYKGRVSGIILGNEINNSAMNYNMGNQTIRNFTDSYIRAFRIVYNTVRSVSSKTKIYMPIGNSWDKLFSSDTSSTFSGMAVFPYRR